MAAVQNTKIDLDRRNAVANKKYKRLCDANKIITKDIDEVVSDNELA